MKYWVHYEMEYGIEVEDGHGLTDDQVRSALRQATVDDVGELPDDGTVTITEAPPDAGTEYKMRVSLKPPAYPGGEHVVDFETL